MQYRIIKIVACGFLSFLAVQVAAQNSTNSPYTRYGYGELANRSFGAGRSMGGVGVGLRSSKQINPLNPASYSSMDSLTFLFDFGASAQMSQFNDGTSKQSDLNGNVEYMAMQFPLHKRVAMSVGLLPFSHVGYNFGESKKSSDGSVYNEVFEGKGGISQLYGGLAVDIWKNRLSVGANIGYLFGTNTHSSKVEYPNNSNSESVTRAKEFKINDAVYDFGVQYTQPLNKNSYMVFGLTYAPKKRLKNSTREMVALGSYYVSDDTITNAIYDMPTGLGVGLSYTRENKFMAALDVTLQEWSKATFKPSAEEQSNAFADRLRIAAGAEWIPNLYSRPYLNRMRYRIGANYTNSYIKVNGNGYKEYGAMIGCGFPISDARSYVNLSFEYVKIKPEYKTMIDESYLRMTISYTFNEYWFFKLKLD